ncbi:hypothetical protein BDV25DRAFT_153185 [Aspergillus avenaceus]|uniref:Uncharacterized protein n=1 Tax=Aspergillus avenaceus TaxID=36643 RepID=A0A5N6TXI9_ASPAV|nr:hypothetical protein BDV25DRAFT_153185 [Aspergillus avenaceus]
MENENYVTVVPSGLFFFAVLVSLPVPWTIALLLLWQADVRWVHHCFLVQEPSSSV